MERTEEGREGGREASWSLGLLQASVSTETSDWMNRKQGTGRRVCWSDMIPGLIFLDQCSLNLILNMAMPYNFKDEIIIHKCTVALIVLTTVLIGNRYEML